MRMIVLCERPRQLTSEDAATWLRRTMAGLTESAAVVDARLTELESVSQRWARPWDWLIEIELADSPAARRLVSETAWGDVLSDLRLLGMRPRVAVADPARATRLRRAG